MSNAALASTIGITLINSSMIDDTYSNYDSLPEILSNDREKQIPVW